jgi:uncharacterized membrane protein
MSETQEPAATPSPALPKKRGKLLPIILAILAIAGALTLQTIMIFVLIGLLPSIVAYIVDKTDNRSVFQTVFCCNLAGVLPYVAQLLIAHAGAAQTFMLMGDPLPWLSVYSAAALGWILVGAMPLLLRGILGLIYEREATQLAKMQAQLVKDWGEDVAKPE